MNSYLGLQISTFLGTARNGLKKQTLRSTFEIQLPTSASTPGSYHIKYASRSCQDMFMILYKALNFSSYILVSMFKD